MFFVVNPMLVANDENLSKCTVRSIRQMETLYRGYRGTEVGEL